MYWNNRRKLGNICLFLRFNSPSVISLLQILCLEYFVLYVKQVVQKAASWEKRRPWCVRCLKDNTDSRPSPAAPARAEADNEATRRHNAVSLHSHEAITPRNWTSYGGLFSHSLRSANRSHQSATTSDNSHTHTNKNNNNAAGITTVNRQWTTRRYFTV